MNVKVLTKEAQEVQAKTKVCFKCGEIKSVSEFYKHSKMGDGYLNKCKSCTKKDVSGNYRGNIEKYKEYEKSRARKPHRAKARSEYQKSEKGKAAHLAANQAYRKKNKDKFSAQNKVNNAIRNGKLQKQPCFICGSMDVQAHHHDYSKPLSVIWLCEDHHLWMHGKRKIRRVA